MTFQSTPHDGSRVSYIGEGELFGAHGQLLASMGRGGHVKWASGPKSGSVTLVDTDDLVPLRNQHVAVAGDGLEDSLEVNTLTVTGVRAIQDTEGTVGVMNMLAVSGQLDGLQDIADDALTTVIGRLCHHEVLRSVVAQLSDDEGEALVQTVAHALLRDAFGDHDD